MALAEPTLGARWYLGIARGCSWGEPGLEDAETAKTTTTKKEGKGG